MKEPIPKIIHQIHMGDKPLTEQELYWQNTWKTKNPGWKHILWDDKKIEEELNITHPDVFNKCHNFSEKSDVLRFDILYQFGGLYIDTDFECLKNIDPIFESRWFNERTIVLFKQQRQKICGAFFAATKNNPQVKELIDRLPTRYKTHGHRRNSDTKYGPTYLTNTLGLSAGKPDGNCVNLKTVYPYLWTEPERRTEDFTTTHPEAFAVHHWTGSWLK